MLDVTATGWAVTIGLVVVLLAVDLALAIARPHHVGFREATVQALFYIAVAVAYGIVFATIAGWDFGGQYFAGYIVEKSLSIDNLFVFVVIMTTFTVPDEHRQKVLIIGIVLALVLRVIFIALGSALLDAFLLHVPTVRAAARRLGRAALSPSRPRSVGGGQRARDVGPQAAARQRQVRRWQVRHPDQMDAGW
jgi:Integral membrane protein TerC family